MINIEELKDYLTCATEQAQLLSKNLKSEYVNEESVFAKANHMYDIAVCDKLISYLNAMKNHLED